MSRLERIEKLEMLSSKELVELFVTSIIKSNNELFNDLLLMDVPLILKTNKNENKENTKKIFNYLINNEDIESIRKLEKFNFEFTDNFIFSACSLKKLKVLEYFLERGFDPNYIMKSENSMEKTLLIEVCIKSNRSDDQNAESCIRLLHQYGANLDYQITNQKWTALHLSSFMSKKDVIELLLSLGASKDLLDNVGETAWDIASDFIKESIPMLNPNF